LILEARHSAAAPVGEHLPNHEAVILKGGSRCAPKDA